MHFLIKTMILGTLSLQTTLLVAGPYISGFLKWGQFAVRPLKDEPTPNYYAIAPGMSLGYSLRQVLDLGLYGSYMPGRRESASIGIDHAALANFGAEIALRIAKSIYFGIHGGQSVYSMHHVTSEDDLKGKHTGYGGGVKLGALMKFDKQHFMQVCLDVEQHSLKAKQSDQAANQTPPGGGEVQANPKRIFDSFALSITYTYNSYNSYLIDNTIFKDFLDSTIF